MRTLCSLGVIVGRNAGVKGKGSLTDKCPLLVAKWRVLAHIQDGLGLVQDASKGTAVGGGCKAGEDCLSDGQQQDMNKHVGCLLCCALWLGLSLWRTQVAAQTHP
jgi:hypothetical protein